MKIYLFANNPKINVEYIQNIDIHENDIFMFFNHCLPFNEIIKKNNMYDKNKKIVLLRKNHFDSYWGLNNLLDNVNHFSTIYFVGSHIKEFDYDIYAKNYIIYNQKLYFDDNDKMPTTGFIGYNIAKKYYPNHDIVLVGFDAIYNNTHYKWEGHDYNYEYKLYQLYNVSII